MTPHQETFLHSAFQAAQTSGHIWPEFAASEAALESAWGASKLAVDGLNLFGTKQHQHPEFGTLSIPTREYLHENWTTVKADWVKYPTLADCFKDRMSTLTRLAPKYAHYAAALAAKDGETFVREVSQSWSTDPKRGDKVLAIHAAHRAVFDIPIIPA